MAREQMPKRGDRFVHARKMDDQNRPMICRVTAVRRSSPEVLGWIVYRTHDGEGGKWTVGLDRLADSVDHWLEPR